MLTLPPFKSTTEANEMYDLYLKIADYVPDNKISNIILPPFKPNTKIFHEILLKLNTLNDLDSDRQFRITTAETKEKIIKRTEKLMSWLREKKEKKLKKIKMLLRERLVRFKRRIQN